MRRHVGTLLGSFSSIPPDGNKRTGAALLGTYLQDVVALCTRPCGVLSAMLGVKGWVYELRGTRGSSQRGNRLGRW